MGGQLREGAEAQLGSAQIVPVPMVVALSVCCCFWHLWRALLPLRGRRAMACTAEQHHRNGLPQLRMLEYVGTYSSVEISTRAGAWMHSCQMRPCLESLFLSLSHYHHARGFSCSSSRRPLMPGPPPCTRMGGCRGRFLYSLYPESHMYTRRQARSLRIRPPHALPSTFLVSSSLSMSPRFRIWPAVGASDWPAEASAFRYATCSALTLAAWIPGQSAPVLESGAARGSCRGAPDLLLVVQALVVVLQHRGALRLARVVVAVRVDDVASQNLLPEGKASAGACESGQLSLRAGTPGAGALTTGETVSGRHGELVERAYVFLRRLGGGGLSEPRASGVGSIDVEVEGASGPRSSLGVAQSEGPQMHQPQLNLELHWIPSIPPDPDPCFWPARSWTGHTGAGGGPLVQQPVRQVHLEGREPLDLFAIQRVAKLDPVCPSLPASIKRSTYLTPVGNSPIH